VKVAAEPLEVGRQERRVRVVHLKRSVSSPPSLSADSPMSLLDLSRAS
jgi:hypothetical protein